MKPGKRRGECYGTGTDDAPLTGRVARAMVAVLRLDPDEPAGALAVGMDVPRIVTRHEAVAPLAEAAIREVLEEAARIAEAQGPDGGGPDYRAGFSDAREQVAAAIRRAIPPEPA